MLSCPPSSLEFFIKNLSITLKFLINSEFSVSYNITSLSCEEHQLKVKLATYINFNAAKI